MPKTTDNNPLKDFDWCDKERVALLAEFIRMNGSTIHCPEDRKGDFLTASLYFLFVISAFIAFSLDNPVLWAITALIAALWIYYALKIPPTLIEYDENATAIADDLEIVAKLICQEIQKRK